MSPSHTRHYWYPSLKACLGESLVARDKGGKLRRPASGQPRCGSSRPDFVHKRVRRLFSHYAALAAGCTPGKCGVKCRDHGAQAKVIRERWRAWCSASGGEAMLRADPGCRMLVAELEAEGIVEPQRGPPVGVEHVEFADLNDEDRAMIETFREMKR